MSHLLYVEASPMKASSTSSGIARAFLDAYRGAHPNDSIDELDVWNTPLPPFDADMIGAKFAVLRAQDASEAQRARWDSAVALARRFNAADTYLFSVPMWNFGVPYRFKHFIDVVTLPGQNWSWSKQTGYVPLLGGKKAVLIYSSAGDYPIGPESDPSDFQKPFLRRWLRFIGVDSVQEIKAGPTLADPARVEAMKTQAGASARALAVAS